MQLVAGNEVVEVVGVVGGAAPIGAATAGLTFVEVRCVLLVLALVLASPGAGESSVRSASSSAVLWIASAGVVLQSGVLLVVASSADPGAVVGEVASVVRTS